ncbi:MAG: hypothetical protein RMI01_10535 [Thermodesulfovibrio sp.]|nr:hypothetical protein [Thermodesulfovibrio sp.]
MDEKVLLEIVRKAVRDELNIFRQEMATKEDLKAFATKDDLNKLKGELMFEINHIKSEMVTRDDLKIYITKEDFNSYIEAISERLDSFSRGIMRMLEQYARDVRELHKKFELIDFGLFLTHLDRLAGYMEKKEQERIIAENQLKRQYLEIRDRIKKIENILNI